MNPDTNKFEELKEVMQEAIETNTTVSVKLFRPDGSPVPDHWSIFQVDELVTIKNYTFKIVHIGESHMLLEPYGPIIVDQEE